MRDSEKSPLEMSEDGLLIRIEPADQKEREKYEALIRDDYARCHPGDSLDFLKHRARFQKEAQGLLRDWMAVAARLAREEERHRSKRRAE